MEKRLQQGFLLMLDQPTYFILIMVEMLHAFCLDDLAAYTGDVKVNKNKVVSVREINTANKFTVNRCKCKTKCTTAQCPWIRSNISCPNHCHPGSKCENNNMEQKQKSKKEQILNDHDIKILKDGLLTDNHMLKANTIFKKEYEDVDGITISNIGVSDNSVNVYDSLCNGITQTTKELIAKICSQR